MDSWSYEEAFARNQGLIASDEQSVVRNSRVAIAGMGGVGGIHLLTLTRLGVGKFTIADPDTFEVANFNRQCGATTATIGHSKVESMVDMALAINPNIDFRIFHEPISQDNVSRFLDDADLFVDGIDFFSIDARRLLFATARERGIWAVTAGPVGFSTAWLSFHPTGMSFDDYFDLNDSMDHMDKLVAFAVGLAPSHTHITYLDFDKVEPDTGKGPSASLACQLCSGVASAEALKILLGRGEVSQAPYYFQFDAYRHMLKRGFLWGGNRHPLQQLKRWWLRKKFA